IERQHDIFSGIELWQQLKGLKDKAHIPKASLGAALFVERRDFVMAPEDLPAGGDIESREQAQQGGLSTARGAHDGQRLPRHHTEGDVLENVQFIVAIGYSLKQ
ncbi:MAG: hypothetical protein RIR74_1402, partial [Pseudomonadota bacterium]